MALQFFRARPEICPKPDGRAPRLPPDVLNEIKTALGAVSVDYDNRLQTTAALQERAKRMCVNIITYARKAIKATQDATQGANEGA